MFCPFIKGNCSPNCIFNDNNNCKLLKILQSIDSNTSSDQTESWYIKNMVEDISDKLDEIIKLL